MLLYFNKNGQLLEKLEYGSAPRVGMTNFQIFAYFADLNSNDSTYSNYSSAMIRLKRPDLEGSEYPSLFMRTASITFDEDTAGMESNYFEDDTAYYGFIFNFSNVTDGESIIKLLDTPGMWQATITLLNNNTGDFVTGLVEFNVESAVSTADDDETTLDYTIIQNNIADLLNDYPLKSQTFFVVADITETDLSGLLNGQIIYDKTTKFYYVVDSTAEDGYVFYNILEILDAYVPYTGAIGDVDLGVYDLNAQGGKFYSGNFIEYFTVGGATRYDGIADFSVNSNGELEIRLGSGDDGQTGDALIRADNQGYLASEGWVQYYYVAHDDMVPYTEEDLEDIYNN